MMRTSHVIVWLPVLMLAWPLISPWVQEQETERGAYLAVVAGCQHCHGMDFSGKVVEYNSTRLYAPNLTPSADGLAGWTDTEIATAITRGLRPDGRQLDPVMPYLFYNRIADADLNALVAFLRSLEPVEGEAQVINGISGLVLPSPPERLPIAAPDPTDRLAYGTYLVDAVLACGACHTPKLDTGQPDPTLWLAGGQAFSGEWGTVYAGNLTSDDEGLGSASDEDIILAIAAGQYRQRRPIYAMPWQAYSVLTSDDMMAVVAYLRSLPPVFNPIPPADLRAGYEAFPESANKTVSPFSSIVAILMLLLLGGLIIYTVARQYRHAQAIRETNWVGYFNQIIEEGRAREEAAKKTSSEEQIDSRKKGDETA